MFETFILAPSIITRGNFQAEEQVLRNAQTLEVLKIQVGERQEQRDAEKKQIEQEAQTLKEEQKLRIQVNYLYEN